MYCDGNRFQGRAGYDDVCWSILDVVEALQFQGENIMTTKVVVTVLVLVS
jgi:hypothetical protein